MNEEEKLISFYHKYLEEYSSNLIITVSNEYKHPEIRECAKFLKEYLSYKSVKNQSYYKIGLSKMYKFMDFDEYKVYYRSNKINVFLK